MTNLNDIAREIALAEGLKKSLSIGQIKEVMKLVFKKLKTLTLQEIMEILKKYK